MIIAVPEKGLKRRAKTPHVVGGPDDKVRYRAALYSACTRKEGALERWEARKATGLTSNELVDALIEEIRPGYTGEHKGRQYQVSLSPRDGEPWFFSDGQWFSGPTLVRTAREVFGIKDRFESQEAGGGAFGDATETETADPGAGSLQLSLL